MSNSSVSEYLTEDQRLRALQLTHDRETFLRYCGNAGVPLDVAEDWFHRPEALVRKAPAPLRKAPPEPRPDASEAHDLTRLPWGALIQCAAARDFGRQKYPADDWREISARSHVAAALRHVAAYCAGSSHDGESGLPHLAHAALRILMSLESAP